MTNGVRQTCSGITRMLAVGFSLALAGCQYGVLDPNGPIGSSERTILFNSLVIMLAIIIPTMIATLSFAWWFRASNTKARYLPNWAYSGRIELVVWSIPTLVILFLGGIIWISSYELDPAHPPTSDRQPLEIQVVSLDWKWLFILPDQGVASINQLVVPVETPLHFSLTSASVMNAFFVPQLGSMIYTMNGMTTQLYLQADHVGDFDGRSSHFSGDGFPGMQFKLRSVPPEDFEAWVQKARASGPALDKASYTQLMRQTINDAPSTFSSVEPGMFSAIATQALPPAPGPPTDHPMARVSPRTGG
jgi:cytochrome o ubiquinol oxidase subunit 2